MVFYVPVKVSFTLLLRCTIQFHVKWMEMNIKPFEWISKETILIFYDIALSIESTVFIICKSKMTTQYKKMCSLL